MKSEIDELKAEVSGLKARVKSNERWMMYFVFMLFVLSFASAWINARSIDTINDILVTMINIDDSTNSNLRTVNDALINHKEAIEGIQDHITTIYEMMDFTKETE